ncbi:NAD(P)/FAD-dependent oxidoreductase [Streptomyces caniscabiei]|uniref:FAD-dependent oxidoreductase n=1 Tax=Streptomyces caniscabiei TaxID=2746961 RepID=A0ABU4N2C7_9ACTN|nr:FAD-dependent oxidoreductase [Streptomyces caniscabiei]MBE4741745.1 FAD-dependent oxidoreductase [Streptomyces caniscabiei]MBE4762423.1 FAD-dependent oxidoreductase [Streptomyces caniscabiei]MBE4775682.1 FAD-dependent oxidoreductase [Streptomyces caniscabiei]MBE4790514.1 FAD-dependent oxidoreductase [Streptomyces caniscabiei]MBE4799763.1 FAD-dependent oxidoreductase [Streptomyces caniscabiei]
MGTRQLVVVGASLAGLRAVEAARKGGFEGRITLVGAEPHLPYDRPPLSKQFLDANGADVPPPTFRTKEVFRTELGAELLLGAPATCLDTAARTVVVGERPIGYDALVIATGATARRLPGTEGLTGVHTLRTLDDAAAVRRALDAGARTVVIGAGFIGAETAAAARKRGLDVVVVEAQATPLVRAVGETMGGALASLHRRHGTDLRCGLSVTALEGEGRVERVRLSDGSVLDADLVVVGTGAVPATDWLEGSGLTLDDGVVCDETLRTGAENVYAAGDVARWHNPVFDRPMRLEHWTSAAEQGALAARNALNPGAAKGYATVPYFWSDQYDTRIQFVGVPDAEEIAVADGDIERDHQGVALYRAGDRLVGALAVNRPTEIMKYRRLVARGASWEEGLAFARSRSESRQTADV